MKILLRALLTGILVFALLVVCLNISKSRSFQFFGGIINRIETEEKIIALTFDDGPTKGYTDRILSILADLDIKATFFLTGAELEKNMDEGRKIAEAGHEIGNHSYSHNRMILKTPSFIRNEIESTDKLIRETGYRGSIHFRPPNGKKFVFLPHYLYRNNRKTIMWDVEPDSNTAPDTDSKRLIENTLNRVKPGSIILLHVMSQKRETSLESVRPIVIELKNRGYRFVRVSDLMEYMKK